MAKSLFIAEKPSVAREFARVLGMATSSKKGYIESDKYVVTWCVGHLVTMSYPESYDMKYKKWRLDTLPFIPDTFKYEIIPSAKNQYDIVSKLLNRDDVDVIYICTDSGREGEYIYRLVDQMAQVENKIRKRVWIDSQTDEEIKRGISSAKDWSEYDNLSSAAYLRAKEDYLMGINFTRVLTLKYGDTLARLLNKKYAVISVGRVMTCVLGMVVKRERQIREFVKTPFYKILSKMNYNGFEFDAEWKLSETSRYFNTDKIYRDNGFLDKDVANHFAKDLENECEGKMEVTSIQRKTEKKNPPLLYNLAELQNDCSKLFKISPDETLKNVQELYEKKLVTYPRTDARVLSTAVAKEIYKNINGLTNLRAVAKSAQYILDNGTYKNISKTKYVNDKLITDHYAIIPTGQGIKAAANLTAIQVKIYEVIVRRFLAIFYPSAQYQKVSLVLNISNETFTASFKVLKEAGYLDLMNYTFSKKNSDESLEHEDGVAIDKLKNLKKGMKVCVNSFEIKEGETSPPKRYNSGSIILAMENAGQLIEDEQLREQIKGSGIGTSATRAEILKKLFTNKYMSLNKKTQIITPTLLGELIYDVVYCSIRALLNPELTASWEKGLTFVSDGEITEDEYMVKLKDFIEKKVALTRGVNNQRIINSAFQKIAPFYLSNKKNMKK